MSRKVLFHTIPDSQNTFARVYSRNDANEFCARIFYRGKLHACADYFADDFDDACATAIAMHNHNAR